MRDIYKRIALSIDGKSFDFRICKLDAFSGAQLLQTVKRYLPEIGANPKRSQKLADLIDPIFLALSPAELQRLMTSCLSHTEVLLDAGYQPVMQMGETFSPASLQALVQFSARSASWANGAFSAVESVWQ